MIDTKKLVSKEGFVDVWRSELNQNETLTDTFNRLNDVYEQEYGEPRYSDYNSFQTTNRRRK